MSPHSPALAKTRRDRKQQVEIIPFILAARRTLTGGVAIYTRWKRSKGIEVGAGLRRRVVGVVLGPRGEVGRVGTGSSVAALSLQHTSVASSCLFLLETTPGWLTSDVEEEELLYVWVQTGMSVAQQCL